MRHNNITEIDTVLQQLVAERTNIIDYVIASIDDILNEKIKEIRKAKECQTWMEINL